MAFSRLLILGAYATAVFAVFVGIFFFSTIPTRLGFYRWLVESAPDQAAVGALPATHYGIPWGYTFEELHKCNLTGQTAIVTGANAGIGYEITRALAQQGAQVTMACRNPTKCEKAADRIRATGASGKLIIMTMDTSSLSSVKAFGQAYIEANKGQALDMAFFNAGTSFADKRVKCVPLSEDRIEKVFAANYVGHHLLYRLLEPMLRKSTMARVVQTSSGASHHSYTYRVATDLETLNGCKEDFSPSIFPLINYSYSQSKLAQILWTQAITKQLGHASNIFVNAFHPGVVNTEIWDKGLAQRPDISSILIKFLSWLRSEVMWTSEEGALTGLFLGVATDRLAKENVRGKFFHPQTREVYNALADDAELEEKLIVFSDELVKDFLFDEETEDTTTP